MREKTPPGIKHKNKRKHASVTGELKAFFHNPLLTAKTARIVQGEKETPLLNDTSALIWKLPVILLIFRVRIQQIVHRLPCIHNDNGFPSQQLLEDRDQCSCFIKR